MTAQASRYLRDWPKESREAAQLVVDQYGEPDEATPTPDPDRRIVSDQDLQRAADEGKAA